MMMKQGRTPSRNGSKKGANLSRPHQKATGAIKAGVEMGGRGRGEGRARRWGRQGCNRWRGSLPARVRRAGPGPYPLLLRPQNPASLAIPLLS